MLPDGPGDTIKYVIKSLKLKKPMLYGYDWGGAIALKLGIQAPNNFSKIVALMPSFNEEVKDELKKLKTPTLIQWAIRDDMHPWSKWKLLAKKIPKVTIQAIDPKPWKQELCCSAYDDCNDVLMPAVSKFLVGKDPNQQVQEVYNAPVLAGLSTKGMKINEIQGISIIDDLTEDQILEMTKKPDIQRDAVELFIQLVAKPGTLDQMVDSRLKTTHPEKERYKKLIRVMPEFTLENLADPRFLVDSGCWKSVPGGW